LIAWYIIRDDIAEVGASSGWSVHLGLSISASASRSS